MVTHDCCVRIPVFGNDQDIARLAATVDARPAGHCDATRPPDPGHGFYTWGDSMEDALRHVEAFEFLYLRTAYARANEMTALTIQDTDGRTLQTLRDHAASPQHSESWAYNSSAGRPSSCCQTMPTRRQCWRHIARISKLNAIRLPVCRCRRARGRSPAEGGEMRQKFLNEHTHADFEVRFFVDGSGLFYLHVGDRVYLVLCEKVT